VLLFIETMFLKMQINQPDRTVSILFDKRETTFDMCVLIFGWMEGLLWRQDIISRLLLSCYSASGVLGDMALPTFAASKRRLLLCIMLISLLQSLLTNQY
jgi:hypothetical protein